MSVVMVERTNRLAKEKSPYLLQHKNNPVDWFPWCEEAFEKAKKEDKPIFLSIGYSTCHWCHVMERESFEDTEVAEILNRSFISIKVDREERPDVDSIYMNVCQAVTGSGGWPLTTIMTPDKKPFFSGTYFSKNSAYGRAGLIEILSSVEKTWNNKRDDLISSSEEIVKHIQNIHIENVNNEEYIDKATILKTYQELKGYYEPSFGGFGDAPKFPTPHNLLFLLRYWKVTGEKRALQIVEDTLVSMYKGGIFDHIGFGFSRYSTDKKWLVPHFEKMLYDNALLAVAYTEAYQATKKEFYKETAEKIFKYILRDMTSEEGGFYSAEDADSEGVEGEFYLWTVPEIHGILGIEDGDRFCSLYNIITRGNFEGKNIPNLIDSDINKIEKSVDNMRKKLFKYRENRVHPYKDDKILTSWNGLMIAALAYAGRVFNNEGYINTAKKSAEFILHKLVREDGRLLARYREGEAAYEGYLDDYAFFIWGLIEIYEADFEVKYLKKALELCRDMKELFWDENRGGFFLYGKDSEKLILRPKDIYDGAVPSGNSVAVMNLLRLYSITGDMELKEIADKLFMIFGKQVKEHPSAYTFFMTSLMQREFGSKEIVITTNESNQEAKTVVMEINRSYNPFATVVLNDKNKELLKLIPSLKDKNNIKGKTTMYVCENFTCSEPITEISDFVKKLLVVPKTDN